MKSWQQNRNYLCEGVTLNMKVVVTQEAAAASRCHHVKLEHHKA
jgi:hypothetical protein